ncbi:MAG: M15 family metallopeptidase [Candidatus Humimicrobiaceae bacterium]
MGRLREQQSTFIYMVAELIIWAYDNGYSLTFGDAFAKDGHSKNSFHYKRLAVDLNLFKDGVYLTRTEDHAPLGAKWIEMGGTWGGNFKNSDGNHYSYGE